MSRVRLTDQEWILDQGKQLWPAREPPTEEERWVWEGLAMLTERQRAIVEMRIYEHLSFAKIGVRLEISKQAVHAMYSKALEIMKERGAP